MTLVSLGWRWRWRWEWSALATLDVRGRSEGHSKTARALFVSAGPVDLVFFNEDAAWVLIKVNAMCLADQRLLADFGGRLRDLEREGFDKGHAEAKAAMQEDPEYSQERAYRLQSERDALYSENLHLRESLKALAVEQALAPVLKADPGYADPQVGGVIPGIDTGERFATGGFVPESSSDIAPERADSRRWATFGGVPVEGITP